MYINRSVQWKYTVSKSIFNSMIINVEIHYFFLQANNFHKYKIFSPKILFLSVKVPTIHNLITLTTK
jgi:hypothetical protein